MSDDRKYRAIVNVTITYHGVPCRDTTDATQQVMSRLPIKQLNDIADVIRCDESRIGVRYVTMYC